MRIFCLILSFFFLSKSFAFEGARWQWPSSVTPWSGTKNEQAILPIALTPLIVIDAGHGGLDKGTSSLSLPKIEEKTITLSTANYLQGYLKKLGFRTNMIRSSDNYLTLQERVERSNAQKPLVFVSIHYNAAKNLQAEGIEVYYFSSIEKVSRSEESKKLASYVLTRLLQTTAAKSRGVKHGNLAVVRDTATPAILVEGGFMTNEDEMVRLRDSKYQRRVAWGIALGIRDYYCLACKNP